MGLYSKNNSFSLLNPVYVLDFVVRAITGCAKGIPFGLDRCLPAVRQARTSLRHSGYAKAQQVFATQA